MEANPKLKYIEWADVYKGLGAIEKWLEATKFKPTTVIGVCRGGWVPARLIADSLGISDLRSIHIQAYDMGATKPLMAKAAVNLSRSAEVVDIRSQYILIIDDICDTGRTLEGIQAYMSHQDASFYRVGFLTTKQAMLPEFAFAAETIMNNDWIVYPWDQNEFAYIKASTENDSKQD